MDRNFAEILKEIERPAPPARLLASIMARIAWEHQVISLKRRMAFFGAATVASLAALQKSLVAVKAALDASGAGGLLSLAVSDTRTVLSNWGDFVVGVLESLPIGTIAAFLTVILCLAVSVRMFIRAARPIVGRHAFNA